MTIPERPPTAVAHDLPVHLTRFIGREKGYHGVGFGGLAVGGDRLTLRLPAALDHDVGQLSSN